MTITPPAPVSLLDSARTAERTRAEWEIAVLAKGQETERQQGSAIVALIEAAIAAPEEAPVELDQLA